MQKPAADGDEALEVPMFTTKTKAIVWGMQTRVVQVGKDFIKNFESFFQIIFYFCIVCWISFSYADGKSPLWLLWFSPL